jgi:hypothetical protein
MLIHTLLAEAWNLQNNKTYYDNEEYLQKYVFIQKTINNKIIEDQKTKTFKQMSNFLQSYKISQSQLRNDVIKSIKTYFSLIQSLQDYFQYKTKFFKHVKQMSIFLKNIEKTISHYDYSNSYLTFKNFTKLEWQTNMPIHLIQLLCDESIETLNENNSELCFFIKDLDDEKYETYFKKKLIEKIKEEWLNMWNTTTDKNLCSYLNFIDKCFKYCKEIEVFTFCIKKDTRKIIEDWFNTLFVENSYLQIKYFKEFSNLFLNHTTDYNIVNPNYFSILIRYFSKESNFLIISSQWEKWLETENEKYDSVLDFYCAIKPILNYNFKNYKKFNTLFIERCIENIKSKNNIDLLHKFLINTIEENIYLFWSNKKTEYMNMLMNFWECLPNKFIIQEKFDEYLRKHILHIHSKSIQEILEFLKNNEKVILSLQKCYKSQEWLINHTKWLKMLKDIRESENLYLQNYYDKTFPFIGTSSFYIETLTESSDCIPYEIWLQKDIHIWFKNEMKSIQCDYTRKYSKRKLYLIESYCDVTLQWDTIELICSFSIGNELMKLQQHWDENKYIYSKLEDELKQNTFQYNLFTYLESKQIIIIKKINNNVLIMPNHTNHSEKITLYLNQSMFEDKLNNTLELESKETKQELKLIFKKKEYLELIVMRKLKKNTLLFHEIINIVNDREQFPFFIPTLDEVKNVCSCLKEREYITYNDDTLTENTKLSLFED